LYINKSDDSKRRAIDRGIKRFLIGLLSEVQKSKDSPIPSELQGREFSDHALHLVKIRLIVGQQHPSLYTEIFNQPPPTWVYEEYLNMICRNIAFVIVEVMAEARNRVRTMAESEQRRQFDDALRSLLDNPITHNENLVSTI
jgi:hypothetical protein